METEEYKEKLEMEEDVPVSKSVYRSREDLVVVLGSAARCPLRMGHCEGGRSTKMCKAISGESSREEHETKQMQEPGETKDVLSTSSSSSSGAAPASSSSIRGAAARTGSSREGNGSSGVDKKADGEHQEDPECEE